MATRCIMLTMTDRAPKFDPRQVPAYSIAEAARIVRLPAPTLRSWVTGRAYDTKEGPAHFHPLIVPAGSEGLSFVNLIEAHVLAAIRRQHGVQMPRVRSALHWLGRTLHSKHPLAEERLETDGLDLFVRRLGKLLNASQSGQVAMQTVLALYLRRVEHDDAGRARLFFPFTRSGTEEEQPREIVIDPHVTFGRPVIQGTRVDTATLFERYEAGESAVEIGEDLGVTFKQVDEAIRFEAGKAKRAA